MKRIMALVLAMLCLIPWLASAQSIRESLAKLSDDELLLLQQYLQEEMESRGLALLGEDAVHTIRTVGEALVWIPQSGSRYHNDSGCSNMKNPSLVSLDVAKELGKTPCKKCDPPR